MVEYNFKIVQYYFLEQKTLSKPTNRVDVYGEFNMLSDLSHINLEYANEIITNLKLVELGKVEEYVWGTEMVSIFSRKDNSIIQYSVNTACDTEKQIQTEYLSALIKDWEGFLETISQ
jgi:hypothetical protein